ncbi:menaquinone-dependent protoporphyrinogen IX dehydrogenase [Glaesserella parasuis]|uniref:menaquinone-dependent protoporphyrinogen IX dehydrogenase n=1 Tax=Glaesserella parasuis TaxID=738 RepID=UPI0003AC47CE|nr:menaquinone-dependent protoporphyrinogen IX dehydrogenase [Glaesserella parasuis]ATW44214.1 protoporphyrinogen oxidase [Glaesserella parasuis D74]EQA07540.1 protoporphyrinogen oxidase [Glaesserella parasuis D74]MDP0318602.1 menaquinone-dependent protoporphyrinogen IX dehydrogenase [Glaesserella parasuis]
MKTAIFYLTNDGQTKKISDYLAKELQQETQVFSLRDFSLWSVETLEQFDCIVIGASIRYGHFDPVLEQFIDRYYELLNRKKSVFFSVNLTARKITRNTPYTNTYTRKLLDKILWKPNIAEVFAGALLYPRYNFFDKTMIRFIMKITKGDTNTSREYEYTDWQQVSELAQRIRKLS